MHTANQQARPAPTARLIEQLLAMDRVGAETLIRKELETTTPLALVEGMIAPALEAIGDLWEQGDAALSQVYMSSRIAEELVDTALQPGNRLRAPQPTMAIVVLEDYHMLGKRIIHSVLRAAGYQVEDLGQMDLVTLTDTLARRPVELLFISTLMLPSALRIGELSRELTTHGIATRLVVGGAPFRFDPTLAAEVGAHATANSAAKLMPVVAKLVKELS